MDKKEKKEIDAHLMSELNIDKEKLKQLKKKLSKIEPRAERGVETLFRLLSKNQSGYINADDQSWVYCFCCFCYSP